MLHDRKINDNRDCIFITTVVILWLSSLIVHRKYSSSRINYTVCFFKFVAFRCFRFWTDYTFAKLSARIKIKDNNKFPWGKNFVIFVGAWSL